MRETVNQAFSLEVPEGFHCMSQEELKQLYQNENPNRWGIWDEERHVSIVVLWKQFPALVCWLADMKTMAQRNQQLTEKGYAANEYAFQGYLSAKAGGATVEGYRFCFRVGDVAQAAETMLLKHKKTVYSLSCVGRKENYAADQETFHRVLSDLKIL